MAATSKKTSKSVAFTTDEADQALLKEIDALLAQQEYASFSDLCKDALEHFFFPEAAQPPVDAVTVDTPSAEQLLQIQNQLEQMSNSTGQILVQLQQQAASLEQAGGGKTTQLESQVTKLAQQLKQVDTRTAQLLNQIQQQLTELEQHLEQQGAGVESPIADTGLDEKLTAITEKIERVELRTVKVLKELQQRSAEPTSTGIEAEAFESAIARHLGTLTDRLNAITDRINAVDTTSEQRFAQLQQALSAVEETVADRGEQYLTQLEEQFARLLEQLTPLEPESEPESEPKPEAILGQLSFPEVQTAAPQSIVSSDDPLLSRLSVLIEDF
jgi:exonuclease VII large subunit